MLCAAVTKTVKAGLRKHSLHAAGAGPAPRRREADSIKTYICPLDSPIFRYTESYLLFLADKISASLEALHPFAASGVQCSPALFTIRCWPALSNIHAPSRRPQRAQDLFTFSHQAKWDSTCPRPRYEQMQALSFRVSIPGSKQLRQTTAGRRSYSACKTIRHSVTLQFPEQISKNGVPEDVVANTDGMAGAVPFPAAVIRQDGR